MGSNRFVKALIGNPLWAAINARLVLGPMRGLLTGEDASDVLEIGCGRGDTTRLLTVWFPGSDVLAVDVDEDVIVDARRRCPSATFDVADARSLPFGDGSFDLVAEFDSFHHVGDWRRAVSEVSRVLREGGRFAVVDLDARFFVRPVRFIDGPVTPFTAEEFDDACAAVGMPRCRDASRGPLLRRVYRKA